MSIVEMAVMDEMAVLQVRLVPEGPVWLLILEILKFEIFLVEIFYSIN